MPYIFYLILLISLTCCSSCGNSQTGKATPSTDSIYTYGNRSEDGIGKFYLGREIAYIMSASGAAWLERNERQKEENTQLAIDNMKLKPDAVVADIGAGTGYYTFRIAKKLPAGKVYAVEVQDEMIHFLNENKSKLHANNVDVIKGSSTSPNLPANSVDLAIMVDVYHELEYPHEMLQSLKTALKPGGKILLLEFRGEDANVPIKALHKTSVMQLNKEFAANGFTLFYDGEFLPIQHFLLYQKVK